MHPTKARQSFLGAGLGMAERCFQIESSEVLQSFIGSF